MADSCHGVLGLPVPKRHGFIKRKALSTKLGQGSHIFNWSHPSTRAYTPDAQSHFSRLSGTPRTRTQSYTPLMQQKPLSFRFNHIHVHSPCRTDGPSESDEIFLSHARPNSISKSLVFLATTACIRRKMHVYIYIEEIARLHS